MGDCGVIRNHNSQSKIFSDSFSSINPNLNDVNKTENNLILKSQISPNIDANNLTINESIIIPFGNIVPTNVSYTSDLLTLNINAMQVVYPFLEFQTIGSSVLGKGIRAVKFGNGSKEVHHR